MNLCVAPRGVNICVVTKSADVEQAFKGPHKLENLVVNEVSLVTEPAILTQAESDAQAGLVVVKLDREVPVPAAIRKVMDLKDGEDLDTCRRRLTFAACKKLLAETGDTDTYFMTALKVFQDHVLMGFWWEDDAPTLAAEKRVAYYNAYFAQDASTKEFIISRVAPLTVTMTEVSPDAADTEEPGEDGQGSGMEMQAKCEPTVEQAAPEAAPVEAPVEQADEAPDAPPAEAAPVAESAEVPATPGITETPDGIPVPGVLKDTEEVPVMRAILELVKIGKSFNLTVGADGSTTVSVAGDAPAPAAPVTRSAPEVDAAETARIERDAAVKERDEMRQKLAKTVSDEPVAPNNSAPGGSRREPTYLERVMAAGLAQTHMRS